MDKSNLCTHVGCLLSHDRKDAAVCSSACQHNIKKGLHAIIEKAKYKVTDKPPSWAKQYQYVRTAMSSEPSNCHHACSPSDYYKGGKCDKMGCYKVTDKPRPTVLDKGWGGYIRCPHCHYIMREDDNHIHFYNIAEQANVKESRQQEQSDPLKISFLSEIGLEPRSPHDFFIAPDYQNSVEDIFRSPYQQPKPLTLLQIAYRLLNQEKFPGQTLYDL